MPEIKEMPRKWFYISPGLMRERKVRDYLEGKGMECFIPLTDKVVVRDGQKKHYKVPYIHNMLFVRTDYNSLKQEKITLTELGMPFAWKMLPGAKNLSSSPTRPWPTSFACAKRETP